MSDYPDSQLQPLELQSQDSLGEALKPARMPDMGPVSGAPTYYDLGEGLLARQKLVAELGVAYREGDSTDGNDRETYCPPEDVYRSDAQLPDEPVVATKTVPSPASTSNKPSQFDEMTSLIESLGDEIRNIDATPAGELGLDALISQGEQVRTDSREGVPYIVVDSGGYCRRIKANTATTRTVPPPYSINYLISRERKIAADPKAADPKIEVRAATQTVREEVYQAVLIQMGKELRERLQRAPLITKSPKK